MGDAAASGGPWPIQKFWRGAPMPNSTEQHEQLYSQFIGRFAGNTGDVFDDGAIDVELLESVTVDRLQKGKAGGIDFLTAEHTSSCASSSD